MTCEFKRSIVVFFPAIFHDLAYLKQRCNNVIVYKGSNLVGNKKPGCWSVSKT